MGRVGRKEMIFQYLLSLRMMHLEEGGERRGLKGEKKKRKNE